MLSALPKFPKFKKLELSDGPAIKEFTSQFPPYSDFNFVSMYTWNINDDMEISNLNGNLAVKFKDYNSEDYFYSFLGLKSPIKSARQLIRHSYINGFGKKLKLVPEIVAKELKKSKTNFEIKSDRDNWDYVLDVEDIASRYKGVKLYTKRKQLQKFLSKRNHEVLIEDMGSNFDSGEILNIFNIWKTARKKTDSDIEDELNAIKRLTSSLNSLSELKVIYLKLDKMYAAFNIFEILGNGYSNNNYAKANTSVDGIFEALNYELAIYLKKKVSNI